MHMQGFNIIDYAIVALYFIVIIVVCWWAYIKQGKSSSDYFLAGRDMGWIAVAASLFASNIGSEHLVGLAGAGAGGGFAVGHFEWLASFCLLALGWLFIPFYLKTGVVSMPEFLEHRFNSQCRSYFTWVSVIGYVLTKISVSLYAGGLIIQELTGISLWQSASVIVIFTGAYTLLGGLRAVIYTDIVQCSIMIIGSVILVWIGLDRIGGFSELRTVLPQDYFSMWRPANDPEFPWTGIVFGAPLLGIWYWCTDQYIVQRVLAARGLPEARMATIFAGYLKILPVFIFVLPGMIAYALFANQLADSPDRAFPLLVQNLLPVGLKGLMLAAMLSAIMSSLSSVFNSCSTLIAWDIFKRYWPKLSDEKLVSIGRIATLILVFIGLAWIPMMQFISGKIYIYLQSVQGYIAPPIAACFLLGIFFKFLNGRGAFTSLIVGCILGFLRLGLELSYQAQIIHLSSDSFWHWYATVNFLHFAIFLFLVSSFVLITVSLLFPETSSSEAKKILLSINPFRIYYPERTKHIVYSCVLILFIIYLWIIYR